MIKSGIVVQLDRKNQSGVIEDKSGREYFFNASDCEDGQLPALHAVVTFVKDPDYKSTNVAMLIKVSERYLALTKRPFFPAA